MKTIITVQEAKTLGRPIGKVSDEKILSFIAEVEQTIIRRALGDELYIKILDMEEFDATYKTLLDGGRYESDVCNCGYGDGRTETKVLTGLKTAEAYYVYAQNVRAGDYESTRYGMVVKDDPYSQGITGKEREQIAGNASAIADTYLNECIEYCRDKGILPRRVRGSEHITAGCIIRKIKV